jgi:hypothetical protein
MAPPCTPSRRRPPPWRAPPYSPCGSTRGPRGRRPLAASRCSVPCPGSGPSSCRRGLSWACSRPARCGAHGGACSRSARSSWPPSAWPFTSASTRGSTTAPPRTRRAPTPRARPMRRSRATTSPAATGWWRCSSTATTDCCAGRRCSRSPSPASGGCGTRAASGLRAPCRLCARSSSRPASAPPRSLPSCSSPPSSRRRCSASGSRRGTCSRGCLSPSPSWRGASATRRGSARRWRC